MQTFFLRKHVTFTELSETFTTLPGLCLMYYHAKIMDQIILQQKQIFSLMLIYSKIYYI